MKYLVTLFWTIIYGQVIGYMGAALTSTQDNPVNALVISIIFGLILCVLPQILKPEIGRAHV